MTRNFSGARSPIVTLAACVLLGSATICGLPAQATAQEHPRFVDLSLLVSPEYPCTWPTFPRFQLNAEERIGPLSPYNSDIIIIDGNTGTQLDVPPHSVTPPDSGFSNAGSFGRSYTDVVPAWQFGGEACVIDCRDLVDAASPGRSPLIGKERVIAWEKAHRPLGPGDVVLFFSGYSDRYYKPMPEGRRYGADPLEGKSPAWPGPDPDCMEYLASRKVMTLGIDSTSMGPIPDLAEPTHFAGLKHGMIWAESTTGLGQLPATGAFYCMLGPKYAGGIYSELPRLRRRRRPARKTADRLGPQAERRGPLGRAGRGPARLVAGSGRGQPPPALHHDPMGHEPEYPIALRNAHARRPVGHAPGPTRIRLPPSGFDNATYSPEVKSWLAEYEAKYGRRGTSDVTTEKVPISQTCGPARVIDVSHLLGTTDKASWPASPEITADHIRRDEAQHGELHPGDIVVFRSGWSDRYSKPLPAGKACLDDPLNGRSEGWPAPGPEAIAYLANKGNPLRGHRRPDAGRRRGEARAHDLLGTRQPGDGRRGILDERGSNAARGVLPLRRGEDPRRPRRPWASHRAVLTAPESEDA